MYFNLIVRCCYVLLSWKSLLRMHLENLPHHRGDRKIDIHYVLRTTRVFYNHFSGHAHANVCTRALASQISSKWKYSGLVYIHIFICKSITSWLTIMQVKFTINSGNLSNLRNFKKRIFQGPQFTIHAIVIYTKIREKIMS